MMLTPRLFRTLGSGNLIGVDSGRRDAGLARLDAAVVLRPAGEEGLGKKRKKTFFLFQLKSFI
jgi:hypothetical protein